MYRYLTRQAGDPATGNDLYQGVWEKVIGARHRYRPDARFTTWLYRIAHNHLVDHFRALRPALPEAVLEGLSADGPEAAELIDAESARQRLQRAIRDLPAEQRDTLLLKLESELSLDEIGLVTGVNRETVKSRLRYASNRLKKILNT